MHIHICFEFPQTNLIKKRSVLTLPISSLHIRCSAYCLDGTSEEMSTMASEYLVLPFVPCPHLAIRVKSVIEGTQNTLPSFSSKYGGSSALLSEERTREREREE